MKKGWHRSIQKTSGSNFLSAQQTFYLHTKPVPALAQPTDVAFKILYKIKIYDASQKLNPFAMHQIKVYIVPYTTSHVTQHLYNWNAHFNPQPEKRVSGWHFLLTQQWVVDAPAPHARLEAMQPLK